MRFNYKKISAIAISTLMTGMTLGVAAAAAYPTPFVSGGVASGTAIVYGTGQGVSALDQQYAGNIQTDLQKYLTSTGGTTVIEGGDAYKLEKTSTKFNLGDYAGNIVSTKVTDDHLPTLLADGVYTDNDNDEFKYTQKIDLTNVTLQVKMFEDNDYKADEPTIGIAISNGANIMNYTLDFTVDPLWEDLVTTDLPFMGKTYYVLSNGTIGKELTLLDSAEDTIISEGETATLTVNGKAYETSISFVSADETKLTVNGKVTNSLKEGQTYKLSDGSYLGVKDIMYSSKDTGVSKVEFSIGSGKLKLTNATDIELNEVTISGLSVEFTNSTTELQAIKIIWDADDDMFITEDSVITMPGFNAVKLSFTGLTYPAEETIKVEADGKSSVVLKNFPLKDSTETINILYYNGTNYTLVGKDASKLLANSENGTLTFDGDTDNWFVASENDTQDYESYLMRATSFKNTSSKQMATFQYRKNGVWTDAKVDADNTDTVTLGSVEFDIDSLDKDSKVAVITAKGNTVFNRLYSDKGMAVQLPWINTTYQNTTGIGAVTCTLNATGPTGVGMLGYNFNLSNNLGNSSVMCTSYPATYTLNMTEEDKNENLGAGNKIVITLGANTNDEVSVTAVNMGAVKGDFTEIGSTDVYRNFAYSELATEAMWDKGTNQYKLTLTYHGDEVIAGVYLTSPEASVTGVITAGGSVLVTDAEVASVSSKNLIIVGGSCINSAAAKVLGFSGATCGAAFTASTGVGTGQFLIKSVTGAYTSGKIALVVAGYDAADTVNGVQYLINKKPDTSKSYKGTSATIAEEVITSA